MNPQQMIDAVLFFVSQWCGTTAPRFASTFLGLVICVLTVTGLWERRVRAAAGIFRLVAGILLIVIGLDTYILHWLVATDFLTRIRLLMGLLSVVVLGVTLEAIRRDQLKERYALLWVATGLIVLMCAFFPLALSFLTSVLGVQYATAAVAVVFTFLVLVAFHFSIVLSGFHENQTRIAQRCALLEERLERLAAEVAVLKGLPSPAAAVSPAFETGPAGLRATASLKRRWPGSIVAVPLVILVATVAVYVVGLATPQPMIGDEVTHYYMLVRQEQTWPAPNFKADIPMGWGGVEPRKYPHTFFWHYLGATLDRVLGPSVAVVQTYQTVFWLQFLVAAFYLARGRGGDRRATLLFLLILASLPMGIIFSVAFYQDVPVAAQILTAFCLLDRRRWLWASIFVAASLAMKETAILFLPAFFLFLAWRLLMPVKDADHPAEPVRKRAARLIAALTMAVVILGISMGLTARFLRVYAHANYYPVTELQHFVKHWQARLNPASAPTPAVPAVGNGPAKHDVAAVTDTEAEIIANHPGDLRRPVNFIIYGGVLLWLGLLMGVAGRVWAARSSVAPGLPNPPVWPLLVGVSYCLPLAYALRTAPDARFFLPGIPFLLLPFVQWAVRLPRSKLIVSIVAVLAILQGGQVLAKTYRLRQVSPDLLAAIEFIKKHPTSPRTVFMYPEGNYRLFPVPHQWYLAYHLREFWKGDNDTRIKMLHEYDVGVIVVKKHLIAPVDEAITDLGVYPDYFVRDIKADPRFRKVFDNPAVTLYLVPP